MINVRRLLAQDFRLLWFNHLITIIFFGLYSLLISPFLDEALNGHYRAIVSIDLIMLLFAQIFGLGLSKYHLVNPFRHDPYTAKMRMLRRLPIRAEEIAAARLANVMMLSVVNTIMFLLPAYIALPNFQEQVGVAGLIASMYLICLISIIMSSMYAYIEIGYSYKLYFKISCLCIVLTIVLLIILNEFDVHPTIWLLRQAEQGFSPLVYLLALVITGFIVYMFWRITVRRLEQRDYYK